MKSDLLSLWLIGGVLYAGGTLISHKVSHPFRDDRQLNTAADEKSSVRLLDSKEANVESSHDIGTIIRREDPRAAKVRTTDDVWDQTKVVEVPAEPIEEARPTAGSSTQLASNPRIVKVRTSATIRNGPSTSANAIGTAKAGTEGRLVSRDSSWIQIEDPQTGRTGWIYSGFLEQSKGLGFSSVKRLEDSLRKRPHQKKAQPTADRSRMRTYLAQHYRTRALPERLPSDMEFVQTLRPMRKRLFKEGSLPPWDPNRF